MNALLAVSRKGISNFSFFIFTETIYTTEHILYYSDNVLSSPSVRSACWVRKSAICRVMGFTDTSSWWTFSPWNYRCCVTKCLKMNDVVQCYGICTSTNYNCVSCAVKNNVESAVKVCRKFTLLLVCLFYWERLFKQELNLLCACKALCLVR